MKVHIVKNQVKSGISSRWLVIGGVLVAVLSTVLAFASQIIFTILTVLGVVSMVAGVLLWIFRRIQGL